MEGDDGPWKFASNGEVPPNAVLGGHRSTGGPLYVARAEHKGDLIPGKLSPLRGFAYVSWRGKEYEKSEYQVLVGDYNHWVKATNDSLPSDAFVGGKTKYNEVLYVGRARHDNSLSPGKVQRSARGCYIPYNHKEVYLREFEVLIAPK